MSNLIKLKKIVFENKQMIKTIMLIISSPFILIVLNLILNTLFELGIYVGTFIRFLYSIVVY